MIRVRESHPSLPLQLVAIVEARVAAMTRNVMAVFFRDWALQLSGGSVLPDCGVDARPAVGTASAGQNAKHGRSRYFDGPGRLK